VADDDWAPAAPSPLAQVVRPEESATSGAPQVQVPGYADLVEVARGGDSIVFRARQLSVDRAVAIKVVQTQGEADAARFERELRITVRLGRQHPHIVTVIDTTTTTTGQPCLVMEFHDLGSLHDRLRATGPLPVSDVVTAGTAVADALAFAHANGVLHRDVKPQNVLVLPTSYVLSDFGIARMADAGHTATLERFSYRHASPQVLDGLAPTEADDLWSLGSTLFTLLDGRSPFASPDPDDDTALSYLRRVRLGERRTLDRDDVPRELADLIDACLRADRDARPASATEVLRTLRGIRTEDRSWQPDGSTARAGGLDAADDGDAARAGHRTPTVEVEPPSTTETGWAPAAASAITETPGSPATSSAPPAVRAPSPAPANADADADARVAPEVAPSVLAHVARQRQLPVVEEASHTGLLSPAPPGDDVTAADDAAPAERRSASPARRALAFLGGALLVGIAIGAGALVVERLSAPPEDDASTQPSVIPSATGPIETNAPIDVEVSNPALAPIDPVLVDNGTSVELSWTAPQQDADYYLVLQLDEGSSPKAVSDILSPVLTKVTIEGLDPDGRACFAVVGLNADMTDRGVSGEVCRTP